MFSVVVRVVVIVVVDVDVVVVVVELSVVEVEVEVDERMLLVLDEDTKVDDKAVVEVVDSLLVLVVVSDGGDVCGELKVLSTDELLELICSDTRLKVVPVVSFGVVTVVSSEVVSNASEGGITVVSISDSEIGILVVVMSSDSVVSEFVVFLILILLVGFWVFFTKVAPF